MFSIIPQESKKTIAKMSSIKPNPILEVFEGKRKIALTIENLNDLEKLMLSEPQVEAPVIHTFGPGLYIREVSMRKGTLALGYHHKYEHLNIMLKGKVRVLDDNCNLIELVAPFMSIGKPGRKFGIVLEDTVWLNVFSTDETDIEKLEEQLILKTDYAKDFMLMKKSEKERSLCLS